MNLKNMVKWNRRMSAVYAVGIWTMVGSYAFFKYTCRHEDVPERKEEEVHEEDPNQVFYKTEHSKTIIVYKKDFVPYSTRISNFIKSFSGDPGSGDRDK